MGNILQHSTCAHPPIDLQMHKLDKPRSSMDSALLVFVHRLAFLTPGDSHPDAPGIVLGDVDRLGRCSAQHLTVGRCCGKPELPAELLQELVDSVQDFRLCLLMVLRRSKISRGPSCLFLQTSTFPVHFPLTSHLCIFLFRI